VFRPAAHQSTVQLGSVQQRVGLRHIEAAVWQRKRRSVFSRHDKQRIIERSLGKVDQLGLDRRIGFLNRKAEARAAAVLDALAIAYGRGLSDCVW
jgi:hypothetical protein